MLDDGGGFAELKRNDLASQLAAFRVRLIM